MEVKIHNFKIVEFISNDTILNNPQDILDLMVLAGEKDANKIILHENNISHGDLPDNVMLDPQTNNPIIIDWENANLNAGPKDKEIDYNTFMMGTTFKILK